MLRVRAKCRYYNIDRRGKSRERTNSLRTFGPLCRLWSGTSARGVPRLMGRLAGARVTIQPAREQDEQSSNPASHTLLLSQADAAEAPGQDYGPSMDLCELEEKTSASGRVYLAGWIGTARAVVVRVDGPEGEAPKFLLRLTGKRQDAARTPQPRRALDGPSLPLDAASGEAGHACRGERQQPALPLRGAQAARPAARHDERPRQQRVRMPAIDEIPF
jgi:hypothetical protein